MSKIQDIARNASKKCLLLQIYCNRRYEITVTVANREKGDGTVYKWKDYGDNVFEIILTRYPSASLVIVVNDYHENDVINVKDGELQKRSADFVGGQTKNVFLQKKYIFQV